jgi:hypothetical protein
LLAGKVVYGEDNRVRDCTIRDISDKGGRITLGRGECVPTKLYLINRRAAYAYEARVAWINGPNFGLTFVNSYSLESELPAHLRFLNPIWAAFRSPLGNIADGSAVLVPVRYCEPD